MSSAGPGERVRNLDREHARILAPNQTVKKEAVNKTNIPIKNRWIILHTKI
jgi:hypothetical protein